MSPVLGSLLGFFPATSDEMLWKTLWKCIFHPVFLLIRIIHVGLHLCAAASSGKLLPESAHNFLSF